MKSGLKRYSREVCVVCLCVCGQVIFEVVSD